MTLGPLVSATTLAVTDGLGQRVGGGDDGVAVEQQQRGEADLGVDRAQLLDVEPLALGHAVLLAAGLDDCVHGSSQVSGARTGAARADGQG